jgi:hypothetical protein
MQKWVGGFLTAGLLLASPSMTQADDVAKDIIEAAFKAHGGADNLAKLKTRREKAKLSLEADGKTFTFTSDSLIQLPCQERKTTRRQATTFIHVINGDRCWSNIAGRTREASAEQLKFRKEGLHGDYVVTLAPLAKEKGFTLSPLGEIKVDDRPALGVKVSAKDRLDQDLYFDKETGLLVKRQFRIQDPVTMQERDLEFLYTDYKETEGLKWPRKILQYSDGKKVSELEITELSFRDKFDDAEFAKP